jgi:hypothetical protein
MMDFCQSSVVKKPVIINSRFIADWLMAQQGGDWQNLKVFKSVIYKKIVTREIVICLFCIVVTIDVW